MAKKNGCLSVLGNIIWIIFGGLEMCIGWLLTGALLCITIIGIPFGLQLFKLAGAVLVPFGKTVNSNFSSHPVMNVIWVIIFGWGMALSSLVIGIIYCITIIGIPFGKQWFKLAKLSLFPFGATIA